MDGPMDGWADGRSCVPTDAGGALLSAAARGAGYGADCVAAWLRLLVTLPGVSGRPAIGATARSIGRWLARLVWPAVAGDGRWRWRR
jgi:hypothetical protein